MPIELVDDQGNEIDLDSADGGTLRKKLEEALSRNRELEQEVVSTRAETVISDGGYDLVKPEDLEGVSVDEVEAKAKELHEQRLEQRTSTVREILADKGLEGEKLDEAVEQFLAGNPVETDDGGEPAEPDFADLLQVGGETRPSREVDAPGMDDPMGNLTGAFTEE